MQSALHVRFVLRKLFCILMSYIAVFTTVDVRAICLMVAGVYRKRRILNTKAVWKERNFNSSIENDTVFMQSFRFVASYATGEEFLKKRTVTFMGWITLLYTCWGAEPGPHCPAPISKQRCGRCRTVTLQPVTYFSVVRVVLCIQWTISTTPCPSTHFISESK